MFPLVLADRNYLGISDPYSEVLQRFNVFLALEWACVSIDLWQKGLSNNPEEKMIIADNPGALYAWTAVKAIAPKIPFSFPQGLSFVPKNQLEFWSSKSFSKNSLYKTVFAGVLDTYKIKSTALLYSPMEQGLAFGHNIPEDYYFRNLVISMLCSTYLNAFFDLGIEKPGVVRIRDERSIAKIYDIGAVKLAQTFTFLPREIHTLNLSHLIWCKFDTDHLCHIVRSAVTVSTLVMSTGFFRPLFKENVIKILSSISGNVRKVDLSSGFLNERSELDLKEIINAIPAHVIDIDLQGNGLSDDLIARLISNRLDLPTAPISNPYYVLSPSDENPIPDGIPSGPPPSYFSLFGVVDNDSRNIPLDLAPESPLGQNSDSEDSSDCIRRSDSYLSRLFDLDSPNYTPYPT